MMGRVVVEEDRAGFTTVLLDEPERRNAIDSATVESIRSALVDALGPVVVLGTTDPKAFSSGAGLHLEDGERARVSDSLYSLYMEMRASPKIIVAAAMGHAIGAGAQLLIASDIRIVSPDVGVRFVGSAHGLVVGAWGLSGLVGRGRALDICLTMRTVTAKEAIVMGLVDHISEDPLSHARDYAGRVCALDRRAVEGLKEVVSIPNSMTALRRERDLNSKWDGNIPK